MLSVENSPALIYLPCSNENETKSETIGGPILSHNKLKLIYVSKDNQIKTLGSNLNFCYFQSPLSSNSFQAYLIWVTIAYNRLNAVMLSS